MSDAAAVLDPNRPWDWTGENAIRWYTNQERLEATLEPFGWAVLAAAGVQNGESVLDIGCGCGPTTLELARLAGPSGKVEAVDISELLLSRARERAEAAGLQVTFTCADAATHNFDPAMFDLLFSRFGVMFFDDPFAAFANMARGLKPGGRVVFACWRGIDDNLWMKVPLDAGKTVLPPQPAADPEAPGPLAFAKRARVEAILKSAGLGNIVMEPFDIAIRVGSGPTTDAAIEDAVYYATQTGPLARLIKDVADITRAAVESAVREALIPFAINGAVDLPAGIWIVKATA